MALSKEDRDLLAIVRHFNVNERNVEKLVKKLVASEGIAGAAKLTGFTQQKIHNMLRLNTKPAKKVAPKKLVVEIDPKDFEEPKNPIRKLGPSKATKKLKENAAKEIAALDLFAPVGEPIELTDESPLYVRVAHDMAKAIQAELKPGDQFWTQKECVQKFEITTSTCSNALGLLAEKGWVERIDPNNIRSPYKVK